MNDLSPSRLVGVASSLLGGLAGVLSDIFFLIVLLFFTVVDAGDFASKLNASQCTVSGSPRYLTGSLMAPANISR